MKSPIAQHHHAAGCGDCESGYAGTGANELPGTRWRAALGALISAPMRLHRYRHFHAEVVEDAIRAFEQRKCK